VPDDSEGNEQKRITIVFKRDGTTEKGPDKGFQKLVGEELPGISRKDTHLQGTFLMARPFVTDTEKKKELMEALLGAAELFAHDDGVNKVCSFKFRDRFFFL
jgi:hypothetical protein